jgi:hypothetical protein
MAKIEFPQELLDVFPEMKARWENWGPIEAGLKATFAATYQKRLSGRKEIGEDQNLGPAMKKGQMWGVLGQTIIYGTNRYPYAVYYSAWRNSRKKISKKGKARVSEASGVNAVSAALKEKGSTRKAFGTVLYFAGRLRNETFNAIYWWALEGDRNGGKRA